MELMFWVWLGVVVVAVAVELITFSLTAIWFAAGALVAMILAIFPEVEWFVQLPVFAIVSLALLLSLRKITKKFLVKNDNAKTNSDSLIGMKVTALSHADIEHPGQVKIGGIVWTVIPAEGELPIEQGESVTIVDIKGNKLIATKLHAAQQGD